MQILEMISNHSSMCIRVIGFPIEITEESVTNSMDPKTHTYIFHVRLRKKVSNQWLQISSLVKHIMMSLEVIRHWNRHAGRISLQRQLRSRIWWFAEFCNSHCVSHFAALFIGMGTKISIVENFLDFCLYFMVYDLNNILSYAPREYKLKNKE